MNRAISTIRLLALALAPLLVAVAAPAQARGVELKSMVQVEQQIEADGRTIVRLVEPKAVVPGDRLVFTTAYENNGQDTADDVTLTNLVPSAITFVEAGNTEPSQVSVDGGATWGELGSLTVSDGAGGRRPATPSDVTHVRWTLPRVAPGATGMVSYRGMVR